MHPTWFAGVSPPAPAYPLPDAAIRTDEEPPGRVMAEIVGEHNGIPLIYSKPGGTKGLSETQVRTMFEPYRARPWIWIVDCAGAQASNLQLIHAIYRLIEDEHATSLQHVWLVNVPPLLGPLLQMFPTYRLAVLPRDRLEIFVLLQRAGYSHANVSLFLAIADPAANPSQIRLLATASTDK